MSTRFTSTELGTHPTYDVHNNEKHSWKAICALIFAIIVALTLLIVGVSYFTNDSFDNHDPVHRTIIDKITENTLFDFQS